MDRSGRQNGRVSSSDGPPGERAGLDPAAVVEAVAEDAAARAAVELALDPTLPARVGLPEGPFTQAVATLVAAAGPVVDVSCARIERAGLDGARQIGLRVTVTGDARLADASPDPWRALDGRLRVEAVISGRVTAHGELWPAWAEEAAPPLPKRLLGRALVVEDNPRVRAMLVHALEGAGYCCDAAATFDEALRPLGAGREGHALLVVDADLPTAPAPAAALVFAELAAARGAGALLMSRASAAGPASVAKPLTRARLAAALAAVAPRGGIRRAPAAPPAAAPAAHRPAAPAAPRTAAAPEVTLTLDPALADLLPDFVRNRAADVRELRAARAAGDEATARRICHGIKGCGGAFGFPHLSVIGAAIGQEAREGRLATTGPAIDELDRVVAAIAAAVGVELGE